MKKWERIGRLFLLVLLVTVFFVYGIIFINSSGWLVLTFIFLVSVVEGFTMISSLKKLLIESSGTLMAHVYEEVSVKIKIKNKRTGWLFFPKIQTIENKFLPMKWLLLYQGEEQTLEGSWEPTERGKYTAQAIELIASDFFSWLKKKQTIVFPVNWLALPKIHPKAKVFVDSFKDVLGKSLVGESSFNVRNYRNYQAGDSVKNIDWKLSSHHNEVILKEYELFEERESLFIFYGQGSEYFEEMLSLIYSIQREIAEKKQTFWLFGSEIEDYEIQSLEDYVKIQALISKTNIPLVSNKNIFLFVPEITHDLQQQVTSLERKNNVYLFDYHYLIEEEVYDGRK